MRHRDVTARMQEAQKAHDLGRMSRYAHTEIDFVQANERLRAQVSALQNEVLDLHEQAAKESLEKSDLSEDLREAREEIVSLRDKNLEKNRVIRWLEQDLERSCMEHGKTALELSKERERTRKAKRDLDYRRRSM